MPPLPEDIDSNSRNRLPVVRREDLDEAVCSVFDEVATPSAVSVAGLQGPGGIMLHAPTLVTAHRAYNRALRTLPDLPRDLIELAILVVAREMDQQFEWTVHEREALSAGLSPSIIDVVRWRKSLEGIGEKEALIVRLGREVFRDRRVSPMTYADAERVFERQALVGLSAIMASYTGTAVLLTIFDQQLPPEIAPSLPDVPRCQ